MVPHPKLYRSLKQPPQKTHLRIYSDVVLDVIVSKIPDAKEKMLYLESDSSLSHFGLYVLYNVPVRTTVPTKGMQKLAR